MNHLPSPAPSPSAESFKSRCNAAVTDAVPPEQVSRNGGAVIFNANNFVWLKLTNLGRRAYDSHYAEIAKHLPARCNFKPPELKERGDGYCCFQLWNAMQIFGPHLYLGGPSLFSMDILIDSKGIECVT